MAVTVTVTAVVMTGGRWDLKWDPELGVWRVQSNLQLVPYELNESGTAIQEVTGDKRQLLNTCAALYDLPYHERYEQVFDYPPEAFGAPPSSETIATGMLAQFAAWQTAAADALVGKTLGATMGVAEPA